VGDTSKHERTHTRDLARSRQCNPQFHDYTGEWADGLLVVNRVDPPMKRARTGAVWRLWDTDNRKFVYLRSSVIRKMQQSRARDLAAARATWDGDR
jgi:hypothetical protein